MKKTIKKAEIRELCSSEKTVLIDMLQEQNNLQKEQINRLQARLKKLEDQKSKNSRNSSKPPSSDQNKQKRTTSSKPKSDKKPGGQPGHKGHHLKKRNDPDEIVRLEVSSCDNCGNDLSKAKSAVETRQEFEIPPPKILVTEYQSESKDCKCCGYTTTACFPEHITHIAQYGVRAKSLMAYMNQYQYIPYDRASQFFETVYGHRVSPGTIVNAVDTLANRLKGLDEQIKDFLSNSKLNHVDETSMSILGKKKWLHTVGNAKAAHFAFHKNRGVKATQEIGILPEFKGIMVHDCWKSYFLYEECLHALCNAHHIRELRFIHENHNMKWANKMLELLVNINKHKHSHFASSKTKFSKKVLDEYNQEYDNILAKAKKEHTRHATKDSKNLIKRLAKYKQEALLFMHDFSVPFTNNLAEGDFRMAKVKQKISGCFRSLIGADNFCLIRNLLVTAKKNNKNIFNVFQQALQEIISLDDLLKA